MNPLVIVRGAVGLALPGAALGAAYLRHRRRRTGSDHVAFGRDGSLPGADGDRDEDLRRPSSRALQGFAGADGDLKRVDLRRADLSRFDLSGRDLRLLDLSHAVLAGSDLTNARLVGSTLNHATLDRCDLRGADLTATSVLETSFWQADLRGTDLSLCLNIVMANFRGARYDLSTRWPRGFDPQAAGARLEPR